MVNNEFHKKLIINIAIALGLIVIVFIILIFLGRDISARITKIENFQRELKFRTNSLESLAVLKQEAEKAIPYFNTLQTILPTQDELINFRQNLNKLAGVNNVDLRFSFRNEMPITAQEPAATTFSFTLSSSYYNFLNFLQALENSQYFIELESIDLTRENKTKKFSGLISGKVFHQ